jgi:hypothetical protein
MITFGFTLALNYTKLGQYSMLKEKYARLFSEEKLLILCMQHKSGPLHSKSQNIFTITVFLDTIHHPVFVLNTSFGD